MAVLLFWLPWECQDRVSTLKIHCEASRKTRSRFPLCCLSKTFRLIDVVNIQRWFESVACTKCWENAIYVVTNCGILRDLYRFILGSLLKHFLVHTISKQCKRKRNQKNERNIPNWLSLHFKQKITKITITITKMTIPFQQRQSVTDKEEERLEEAVRRFAMIATWRNNPSIPIKERAKGSHLSMVRSP